MIIKKDLNGFVIDKLLYYIVYESHILTLTNT